jgi:hypothetical protein
MMHRRAFLATTAAGAASAMLGISLTMAQTGPPFLSQNSVGIASFSVVEASVAGLEAAYISGQITARAITQAHLDRIAAYDKRGPLINSLITVNPRALEEADRLDALLRTTGRVSGPLHGIPVIVKDNIDVAGLPMTSGFQGWKNYYPSEDAPLVKKIRAAGGIILAKSSLSEFARGGGDNINSVVPGFARNPYNTAFATGGSSGGTAAALAAGWSASGQTPVARCVCRPHITRWLGFAQPSASYQGPVWCPSTRCGTPPGRWLAALVIWRSYSTLSLDPIPRTWPQREPKVIAYRPTAQR